MERRLRYCHELESFLEIQTTPDWGGLGVIF